MNKKNIKNFSRKKKVQQKNVFADQEIASLPASQAVKVALKDLKDVIEFAQARKLASDRFVNLVSRISRSFRKEVMKHAPMSKGHQQ